MLKNNSFEVGVRWRRSGRVRGEPSINFEGRRVPVGLLVGGGEVISKTGSNLSGGGVFSGMYCTQPTSKRCQLERIVKCKGTIGVDEYNNNAGGKSV